VAVAVAVAAAAAVPASVPASVSVPVTPAAKRVWGGRAAGCFPCVFGMEVTVEKTGAATQLRCAFYDRDQSRKDQKAAACATGPGLLLLLRPPTRHLGEGARTERDGPPADVFNHE
jgi:hypothetical protein